MKERVFIKKNIFTSVMFGAVFLFVLFESIFYRDNLSGIAFLISIPIFILSLIKIIIDISEDINDKITSFLSNVENYPTYYDDFSWEYLEQINACSDNTFKDTIENIISDKPNLNHLKDDLFNYYQSRKHRETIRSCRRFFLYIYYTLLMIVLLLLLLHTELYHLLSNSPFFSSINMNLFTLWSLIILLFEIMMKNIVEDIISVIIQKFIGINLEYY